MNYLSWNEKTIDDFSYDHIDKMYDSGFVFTRKNKGLMQETRSLRIDLSKFSSNSENRRILKKVENISISIRQLPFEDYKYDIGKMAKDFYDKKFGVGIMSAQKVKEMITSLEKSNFNTLISYSKQSDTLGYAIAYKSDKILHYSYPFYDLMSAPKDMGLGMMIKAVILAQEKNLSYVYLGSLQRKTDTYKMQFEGMEWWNGKTWSKNIEEAKIILKSLE